MNIFIVRHAESYNNTQGKMLSTTDLALTEKGIKQAEALRKSICNLLGLSQFDYIFSSPLIRAVQTAEIVSESLNIITTDLLGEMNLGALEGLTWTERTSMFPNVDIDNALSHVNCIKGESYLTVESRCTEFVHRLIDNIDDKSNVLITTHGITMRILTNVLLNRPREHVNYLNWAENTALTHIEFDRTKGYGKAICINNRQHLFSDELINREYESWGLFSKSDYLSLA